eukprot:6211723-Pleurochrysis_carterae.AAC.4
MSQQPKKNRDQWRSLNVFHSTYQTSDAAPVLPLSIAPPVGEAETQNVWYMTTGMPVSRHFSWEKLEFRYPRPRQPAVSFAATAPAAANASEGYGCAATGANGPTRTDTVDARLCQRVTSVQAGRSSVSIGDAAAAKPISTDADVTIDWCFAAGQKTKPMHLGYTWPSNPVLKAHMERGKHSAERGTYISTVNVLTTIGHSAPPDGGAAAREAAAASSTAPRPACPRRPLRLRRHAAQFPTDQ